MEDELIAWGLFGLWFFALYLAASQNKKFKCYKLLEIYHFSACNQRIGALRWWGFGVQMFN